MNKDRNIWIILTVCLILGGVAFSFTNSHAEDHDLRKDCYLNMSQQQSLVCMESIKSAVQEVTEQTKELLANVKPIKTES